MNSKKFVVHVEDKWWSDVRMNKLSLSLQCPVKATGVASAAWRVAAWFACYENTLCIPESRIDHAEVLIKAGLVERYPNQPEFLYVKGSRDLYSHYLKGDKHGQS